VGEGSRIPGVARIVIQLKPPFVYDNNYANSLTLAETPVGGVGSGHFGAPAVRFGKYFADGAIPQGADGTRIGNEILELLQ